MPSLFASNKHVGGLYRDVVDNILNLLAQLLAVLIERKIVVLVTKGILCKEQALQKTKNKIKNKNQQQRPWLGMT